MELRAAHTLFGPNLWSDQPVIELLVTATTSSPKGTQLAACRRLQQWLPGLGQQLTEETQLPLEQQLQKGLSRIEVLPHVMSELHFLARQQFRPRPRAWLEKLRRNEYRVAVELEEPFLGEVCRDVAWRLITAAYDNQEFPLTTELENLVNRAYYGCLGSNTRPIAEAAQARGIPFRRLDDVSIVQYGHGERQRRTTTAMTDRIGYLAEAISVNKELTKRLLREIGIPVPEGRVVTDPEDAWRAACELGDAVVVKPLDGDYGNGVSLNITGREAVMTAYATAHKVREQVLVERYAPGAEHRLLVVGDEVVSAIRRDPAFVVGDGRSSVVQLVELENRQFRGDNPLVTLFPLPWDVESLALLEEQRLTPRAVPRAGQQVLLRRKYHARYGGKNVDVTRQIHPQVIRCVLDAVHQLQLEIAGVDLVARDIRRPLEEQQGVIVEVNAGPALFEHLPPHVVEDHDVPGKIVRLLFPERYDQGRIPLAAVAGEGATEVTEAIASEWTENGLCVGLGNRSLWRVDDSVSQASAGSSASRVQALLSHHRVQGVVAEVIPEEVLAEGFGFDRCSLAVFLPGGEEPSARQQGILIRLAELVLPNGVALVSADHPLAETLSQACPGTTMLFDTRPSAAIRRWQKQGRSAVWLAEGNVVRGVFGQIETLGPAEDLVELIAVVALHGLPGSQRPHTSFRPRTATSICLAAM